MPRLTVIPGVVRDYTTLAEGEIKELVIDKDWKIAVFEEGITEDVHAVLLSPNDYRSISDTYHARMAQIRMTGPGFSKAVTLASYRTRFLTEVAIQLDPYARKGLIRFVRFTTEPYKIKVEQT